MLDFVKLDHLSHRYPSQISGGEARRVSIARTLAPKPSCLLMDEPLIHLDPSLKEEIMTLIMDGVQENRSCLVYVTHDQDEAAQIADRVQVMRNGRMEMNSSLKAGG
jgi:ABC-type sulfate/molybdate transport systems ATPase subunit